MTHPATLLLTAATAAIFAALLTLSGRSLFASELAPDGSPAGADVAARALQETRVHHAAMQDALRAVIARIETIENARDRAPLPPPSSAAISSPPDSAAKPTESAKLSKMSDADFRANLSQIMRAMDANVDDETQAEFWRSARSSGRITSLIDQLKQEVKEKPNDANLRMELGDAYVARLLTVPMGPERGVWGMKAEREWKEALDIDPDHWDAQYTLAFSFSMYPDFLNKTDDAILGFERALEIQKAKPHEPRHAKTYEGLVRMYKKKGRMEDAIRVLREAVTLYPQNGGLATTLEELEDEAKRARNKKGQ